MSPRPKFAAAATQPGVGEAALDLLARGNAVDAVCAGVLAAAALEPGVLFGPLHVLLAGPGFGVRCIDGRLRQPGVGAPRPRGFLPTEQVPSAARVAVPALPAAIATALSMFGTVTARRASEPALAALGRRDPRRAVLAALATEGPPALASDALAEAITTAAGRLAGGLVTRDDLRSPRAPALACQVDSGVASAPFAGGETDERDADCHVVCAADFRGGLAVACYEIAHAGVSIDALGVLAPLRARPVLRGERRTDPGAPLPCACPGALVDSRREARFDLAVGATGSGASARLRELGRALANEAQGLEATLRAYGPAVAVAQTDRGARAYSFTP